jgi:hypothetical protein
MATNTCVSVIVYQNTDDIRVEPFLSERNAMVQQMFNEGKCEVLPNVVEPFDALPAQRYWIDHAAAQEFIDFVLLKAPSYNIVIESTSINDL